MQIINLKCKKEKEKKNEKTKEKTQKKEKNIKNKKNLSQFFVFLHSNMINKGYQCMGI